TILQAQKRLIALDKKGHLLPPQRIFLAISCKVLGLLSVNADRYEEAAEQFELMRSVLVSMVEAMPKAAAFRNELVDACLALGACRAGMKDLPAARRALRQAREHARVLYKDARDSAALQAKLGLVDLTYAKTLAESKDAVPVLDEAVEVLASACKTEPKNKQFLAWHKEARLKRAAMLRDVRRHLDAVPDLDVVVELETDAKKRLFYRRLRASLFAEAADHRSFADAAEELYRDKTLPVKECLAQARFLAEMADL